MLASENMVRCTNCMNVFHENEIIYDGDEDMEFCPCCGEGGCLMDVNENIMFTIETLNDNGSGMKYKTKEEFLKEISLMIDDCIANGGTFFDAQIDSDVSCFS